MIEHDDKETFYPSIAATVIHRRLVEAIAQQATEEFFRLWELNGEDSDPREAGSIVAGAYMHMAAKIAIFACECANMEPRLSQWLKLATEHFNRANDDVNEAIIEAANNG